ncbi:MAG: hypothetical protein KAI29_25040, partial [Cyclobacteriaceae bacterium]|nr:hypothetical protein [Cyclobacteriaceae bacterium]
AYATLNVDSEGNLIVFKFTEEDGSNQFNVYSFNLSGKVIGESSFFYDEFDFSYLQETFIILGDFVYAAVFIKTGGRPKSRLLKFKF